jgi:organic hydroperoxide reductase OsmC/OhrA
VAHEHVAEIRWNRDGQVFLDGRYSRVHRWWFDGGIEVPASSSPAIVRVPFSREDAIDPEEAFVAALASCHMLFFLYFAAKDGFLIDAYADRAVGILGKREDGRSAITEVRLRPDIAFAGDKQPGREQLVALHHRAHDACYIANSFNGTVAIETPQGQPLTQEKAHA